MSNRFESARTPTTSSSGSAPLRGDTSESPSVAVTRVANSCVLLELGGHAVLTDPFFTERWHLHRGEPLGLVVTDLPPLTAIVASHSYPNHFDVRGLRQYPYKATTPVYVSSRRMARRARAIGYAHAEELSWGQIARPVPEMTVRTAAAGRTLWLRHNAYVLEVAGTRVFFGGEIRDVALVKRHRLAHGPVDIALLPVNGLRAPLGPPIVMGPEQAVDAARALGARTLVTIHDAHDERDPLSYLIRRHGSGEEARVVAGRDPGGLEVVCLPPGRRWEFQP